MPLLWHKVSILNRARLCMGLNLLPAHRSLLPHQKKHHAGFTLIELLVVIIIIGILAAIALPSFLSQANKARQAEAKTNIGVMNRAQQVYFFETSKFAEDTADTTAIAVLGINIKESANYQYTAKSITALNTDIANKAQAKKADIKSYTGGVFALAGLTRTIMCENKIPSTDPPPAPTSPDDCDLNQNRL